MSATDYVYYDLTQRTLTGSFGLPLSINGGAVAKLLVTSGIQGYARMSSTRNYASTSAFKAYVTVGGILNLSPNVEYKIRLRAVRNTRTPDVTFAKFRVWNETDNTQLSYTDIPSTLGDTYVSIVTGTSPINVSLAFVFDSYQNCDHIDAYYVEMYTTTSQGLTNWKIEQSVNGNTLEISHRETVSSNWITITQFLEDP